MSLATTIRRIHGGLKRFGDFMTHWVGMLIFVVLYAVCFAPMAVWHKMTGKRFLPHFTGDETSFFLQRKPVEPTMEFMKKQG